MINEISSWTSNIVVAVVVATILEMILPNSKNKKYIKTVIGVFILFTIISPIVEKFTNFDFSLDSVIASANVYNEPKKINSNNYIQNVYIDNLKKDLSKKISEKGYTAENIKIHVNMKDGEEYGKINEISFNMEKETFEKNENQIDEVNEISVVIKKEDESRHIKKIQQKEIEEIQEYIATTYGVDIQNVKIY